VPDGEGVARDVTRDPVPVGDRLDIVRTHPEAVAQRPGGGEPPTTCPRTTTSPPAWAATNDGVASATSTAGSPCRPRRAHERRACRPGLPCPAHARDRYRHAIPRSRLSDLAHVLAAQVPVRTWHDAETSLNQRSGGGRLRPLRGARRHYCGGYFVRSPAMAQARQRASSTRASSWACLLALVRLHLMRDGSVPGDGRQMACRLPRPPCRRVGRTDRLRWRRRGRGGQHSGLPCRGARPRRSA
jgi:hypothetical protein